MNWIQKDLGESHPLWIDPKKAWIDSHCDRLKILKCKASVNRFTGLLNKFMAITNFFKRLFQWFSSELLQFYNLIHLETLWKKWLSLWFSERKCISLNLDMCLWSSLYQIYIVSCHHIRKLKILLHWFDFYVKRWGYPQLL